MNHVSHETAKRLRQAGFLPVNAEFGQMWYDDQGSFLIAGLTSSGYSFSRPNEFGKKTNLNGCVFAPTATDILKELQGEWVLQRWDGEWSVRLDSDDNPQRFNHENPAEAAAMAWLAQNKKK